MRYIQVALLCLICIVKGYGQSGTRIFSTVVVEITKTKKPKRISTKVSITNPFPAGDSVWVNALEQKLDQSIPFKNGARPGTYIASVRFVIEKDGNITDVQCIKDPGFGMCRQVVDAVCRSIKPHWGPREVRPLHTTIIPDTMHRE